MNSHKQTAQLKSARVAGRTNPPKKLALFLFIAEIFYHRRLFLILAKRDFKLRHQGSLLGLLWSIINPLFTLGVYSAIFVLAFRIRLMSGDANWASAGVKIFIGIATFNLFSETIIRSTTIMSDYAQLLRKTRFPFELLPLLTIASPAINYSISLLLCLLVVFVTTGVSLKIILLPPLIGLYLLSLISISMILAPIGLAIKDARQMIANLTWILTFVSPVFFETDLAPSSLRRIVQVNPISFFIESVRRLITAQEWPNGFALALASALILITLMISTRVFLKSRNQIIDAV